jgi:hypothetical protein
MSLKSDLTIDATKFDRKLADKETEEFNEKLIKIWADGPRWYEVWQLAIHVRSWAKQFRLAQRSTESFGGRARHHFLSPSCSPKESMAQYRRARPGERFLTACSSPLVV